MEVCAIFQLCDDNTGQIDSPLADASMALFFDPMKQEALAISNGCAGYFKFHGDDLYVVKGMGWCLGWTWRLSVRGHSKKIVVADRFLRYIYLF